MGLFGGLFKKLGQIVSGQKIDDEFFDELEEQLILADMGVETAMELVENLRRDARKLGLDSGDAALEHLKAQMSGMLAETRITYAQMSYLDYLKSQLGIQF